MDVIGNDDIDSSTMPGIGDLLLFILQFSEMFLVSNTKLTVKMSVSIERTDRFPDNCSMILD